MRHPQLGIVQPAGFIPRMGAQPALSQFVIARVLADWRYFLAEHRPLDLSINLPISFLDDPKSFDYLCRQLPDDPAFEGLILEIDGSEITRDLSVARDFARQARLRKIAISVDRLGGEWTALLQLRDFPFVEIKVEPELVAGCAHDRAKRTLCRHIVGAANQFGARTVAIGVENYADFFAARELGFDLIQGFLFAKPMGCRHSCALSGAIRQKWCNHSFATGGETPYARYWALRRSVNPLAKARANGRLRRKPLYCRHGSTIARFE
jgi:EAL domain-containing protein (putative c-di-GMP-specific phosphodiesterase class I)